MSSRELPLGYEVYPEDRETEVRIPGLRMFRGETEISGPEATNITVRTKYVLRFPNGSTKGVISVDLGILLARSHYESERRKYNL